MLFVTCFALRLRLFFAWWLVGLMYFVILFVDFGLVLDFWFVGISVFVFICLLTCLCFVVIGLFCFILGLCSL